MPVVIICIHQPIEKGKPEETCNVQQMLMETGERSSIFNPANGHLDALPEETEA